MTTQREAVATTPARTRAASQHSSTPCIGQGHTKTTKSLSLRNPITINSRIKWGATHPSSNTPQPESTATLDESSKFWDCSVLKRAAWIKQLPKTLASDDANYRTLWEEGFVVEKGIAVTQSVRHSYHLSINNIKRCVLTRPCPTSSFVRFDSTIADAEVADVLTTGFRTAPTTLKSHNRDLHDRILHYISNTKGAEDYDKG